MTAEDKHPDDELRDASAEGVDVVPSAADAGSDEVADAVESAEEDMSVRLEEAESRAAEYLDSLQRERAAFQNFKKRVDREREEQRKAITGDVLLRLLPTLDDFHRALSAVPEDERDDWYEGVRMIQRKLERFLEEEGVTEMEVLGEEFDPAYHEAVGVNHDTDADSGTITEVLQRGYMHRDRVLRPAMVRVAG